MQFQHGVEDVRNGTAHRGGHGKFVGNELRSGWSLGEDDADAELFSSKEEGHDFDLALPGGVIPTVGRNKQRAAGLQGNGLNISITFDLVFVTAFERNFQSRKSDDVAEQRRMQLPAANKDLVDGMPGEEVFWPPIQWNRCLHFCYSQCRRPV